MSYAIDLKEKGLKPLKLRIPSRNQLCDRPEGEGIETVRQQTYYGGGGGYAIDLKEKGLKRPRCGSTER